MQSSEQQRLLLQNLHKNSIPADRIHVHFLSAEGASYDYSVFDVLYADLAGVVLVDTQHDGRPVC